MTACARKPIPPAEVPRDQIVIDGLTKVYATADTNKTAVDDLSFTVEPGYVTGFLGPNGAGKPELG